MMATRVFLGDLRHNYSGVLANDCMPLGVAYMKAVMDRDVPAARSIAAVRLSRAPCWRRSRTHPPDVLMLSNYMWNEWLSHFAFAVAKRSKPEHARGAWADPTSRLEPDRQLAYLAAHPEIDVYVLGEGDFLAHDLVSIFLDCGQIASRASGRRSCPPSVYRNPEAGR